MLTVLRWLALTLLAAGVLVAVAGYLDISRAYERLDGRARVIPSPQGAIAFTEGGSGPPVLVIHGSGGGFDQGELIARTVLGDGFHWITPSRFGYPGSTFHPGATFDDQARAYRHLLDQLGIQKVAVVALSHGGPSALLFAALFPERVSALVLLSCGVASSSDPAQLQANQSGDALTSIFRYDPLYWGVSKVFRKPLMKLMGASDAVIAGLTPEQLRLVDQVIDFMNPVKPRSAGVAFDNQAVMPNERIAAIRAPTLIFHAVDDSLQLYRNAMFAAQHIPAARLVSFAKGGHLVMVVEQAAIRAQTQAFVREHAGG